MAHGGYGKRRVAGRKPSSQSSKGPGGVNKKDKKEKPATLKNKIRSIERFLRKDLPPEVREAQQKKLEELRKEQDLHNRLAVERKIFLRDRKIKFFERRKIERRIRRLEKQRSSLETREIAEALAQLKEDLEYVRFFPKTEKYVSLFNGGENPDLVGTRNRLRMQIKANLIAAAASGKDLEETGSEDDGLVDLTDDDFFQSGSSSDEDADDELTDMSAREQASNASVKAASGMSSDERNQKPISPRSLMPPPRPNKKPLARKTDFGTTYGKKSKGQSSNSYSGDRRFSNSQTGQSSNSCSGDRRFSNSQTGQSSNSYSGDRQFSNSLTGQSSNMSSNSDAPKRKRKRRPKKKKQ